MAIVRSHTLISSRASGMLGPLHALQEVHRRAGRLERRPHDPDRLVRGPAARRVRREDHGVLALDAYIAMVMGVTYGLVTGISEAITPAGFAYLTMPFSGISSMIPMLF